MGIEATLYKLSENDFKSLPEDEFDVISQLIPSDVFSNPAFCNLDKSWSMLHYLLCGSVEPDGTVHGDVILGGDDTAIEMDYGPVKYRSLERVREIQQALQILDLNTLYSDSDLSAEKTKDIYIADEIIEDGVESIKEFFDDMKRFYTEAASEGMVVLSYLS